MRIFINYVSSIKSEKYKQSMIDQTTRECSILWIVNYLSTEGKEVEEIIITVIYKRQIGGETLIRKDYFCNSSVWPIKVRTIRRNAIIWPKCKINRWPS
jgi:hypothetical protein